MTECVGFEWDAGDLHKNWVKHQVSVHECEQIFFNQPLLINQDIGHSHAELQYCALGETNDRRQLFTVFTVRRRYVRIISARDMSKKEREFYEKVKKNTEV